MVVASQPHSSEWPTPGECRLDGQTIFKRRGGGEGRERSQENLKKIVGSLTWVHPITRASDSNKGENEDQRPRLSSTQAVRCTCLPSYIKVCTHTDTYANEKKF